MDMLKGEAIAADHGVDADPASVSVIELGLDTAHSATIAPVWAALLTGSAEAQGLTVIADQDGNGSPMRRRVPRDETYLLTIFNSFPRQPLRWA